MCKCKVKHAWINDEKTSYNYTNFGINLMSVINIIIWHVTTCMLCTSTIHKQMILYNLLIIYLKHTLLWSTTVDKYS